MRHHSCGARVMLTAGPAPTFPPGPVMAAVLWERGRCDDTAPVRFHRSTHRDHGAGELARIKRDQTVSVCLPARDEAATVGAIVETIRTELVEAVPLVDELVVIDDHSLDDTAEAATAAGARVVDARRTLADVTGPGKGKALWKSLHETSGDIVLWCDADLDRFSSHFVTGLLGPLLKRADVSFVKATYERPQISGTGGGRVTELLARPVLANLFPELAGIGQPLAGEYGGRRRLLETLPFVDGYGVDLALLVDALRAVGGEGIAEVDLGERRHRNRPLDELGPQATAVLQAALDRAGVHRAQPAVLRRPDHEPLVIAHRELPPLVELDSYRASA